MTMAIAETARPCDVSDDADGSKFAMDQGPFLAVLNPDDGSIRNVPEVIDARIDEAEIPDWVYRRFSTSQWEDVPPAIRIRRNPPLRAVIAAPAPETPVSGQVELALAQCGYPLQYVRCRCDDETLALSGFVTRYFYAQIAVETARKFANGRRIDVQIEVVPTSDGNQSVD